MMDRFLVPSRIIHWERKAKYGERRIQIAKKSFYALARDEMTDREYGKYLDEVRRVEEEYQEVCHA